MTLISIKIQIITTSTQLVYQFKRLSAFIVYQMIKKYFRGKIDDYVVLDTTYCVFFCVVTSIHHQTVKYPLIIYDCNTSWTE